MSKRSPTDEQDSGAKRLLLGQLPLEAETSMFILVNVIDFFMTYWLLMTGSFRESNPIADYFLRHWGPVKGMLYFKLALVTFVCLITQLIALKDVEKARWVLRLGIVVVTLVVLYSLRLLLISSPGF
ncbi:MAG: hypothetical protein HON04_07835 [Planctomicrobium sp.]|jgi:hypothetical protein|nr:hypothetical protein [Planctomicrobium sp.]